MNVEAIANRVFLKKILMASIQSNSIFIRFAQMSDENKAKVVEKVTEKVKDKGKGKGKDAPPEEPPVDDKAKKDEVPPKEEENQEEEAPAGEGFDKFKSELETFELPEDVSASLNGEQEETTDDAPQSEGPEPDSESLTSIVDGITEEISQIKKDGQVTPGEVMGLMDNMMNMVNELLGAKPAKKKKASFRFPRIANRIVRTERIARRMIAKEFGTQEGLDAYLKKHPKSDKSRHTVKQGPAKGKKEEVPAPKGKGKGKEEAPAEMVTDRNTYQEGANVMRDAWAGLGPKTQALGQAVKNKESDPEAYTKAVKDAAGAMKPHAEALVKTFGDNAVSMAIQLALDKAKSNKEFEDKDLFGDGLDDSAVGHLEGMKTLVGVVKHLQKEAE
jgi:hypothetical protein